MRIENLHDWNISTPEAVELQRRLAGQVSRSGKLAAVRYIAGVDISKERGGGITAAAVVLAYPEFEVMETKLAQGKASFPYVPGLLSFREAPLTLAVCGQLSTVPDLFMVDGQGIAHPRRIGIASHLGLFLNKPTIGCAKSRLWGTHGETGEEWGSYTELVDEGEIIGAVLRTKPGAKPLYISTGHMIDLDEAIRWVLNCCRGFRVPEPTRLAHLAAGGCLVTNQSVRADVRTRR